jgi:hypothetical protein
MMVVVTPNADSLGARWFGPQWVHWDPPRHLHIFTSRSLSLSAARAGLACTTLRTTARNARFAWSASSSLKRGQAHADIDRSRGLVRAQSLAFQLFEHVVVSSRGSGGEEIVMVAVPRDPVTSQ